MVTLFRRSVNLRSHKNRQSQYFLTIIAERMDSTTPGNDLEVFCFCFINNMKLWPTVKRMRQMECQLIFSFVESWQLTIIRVSSRTREQQHERKISIFMVNLSARAWWCCDYTVPNCHCSRYTDDDRVCHRLEFFFPLLHIQLSSSFDLLLTSGSATRRMYSALHRHTTTSRCCRCCSKKGFIGHQHVRASLAACIIMEKYKF